eukprot:Nk52_evm15s207 gene=Nk52_evmTU15s207
MRKVVQGVCWGLAVLVAVLCVSVCQGRPVNEDVPGSQAEKELNMYKTSKEDYQREHEKAVEEVNSKRKHLVGLKKELHRKNVTIGYTLGLLKKEVNTMRGYGESLKGTQGKVVGEIGRLNANVEEKRRKIRELEEDISAQKKKLNDEVEEITRKNDEDKAVLQEVLVTMENSVSHLTEQVQRKLNSTRKEIQEALNKSTKEAWEKISTRNQTVASLTEKFNQVQSGIRKEIDHMNGKMANYETANRKIDSLTRQVKAYVRDIVRNITELGAPFNFTPEGQQTAISSDSDSDMFSFPLSSVSVQESIDGLEHSIIGKEEHGKDKFQTLTVASREAEALGKNIEQDQIELESLEEKEKELNTEYQSRVMKFKDYMQNIEDMLQKVKGESAAGSIQEQNLDQEIEKSFEEVQDASTTQEKSESIVSPGTTDGVTSVLDNAFDNSSFQNLKEIAALIEEDQSFEISKERIAPLDSTTNISIAEEKKPTAEETIITEKDTMKDTAQKRNENTVLQALPHAETGDQIEEHDNSIEVSTNLQNNEGNGQVKESEEVKMTGEKLASFGNGHELASTTGNDYTKKLEKLQDDMQHWTLGDVKNDKKEPKEIVSEVIEVSSKETPTTSEFKKENELPKSLTEEKNGSEQLASFADEYQLASAEEEEDYTKKLERLQQDINSWTIGVTAHNEKEPAEALSELAENPSSEPDAKAAEEMDSVKIQVPFMTTDVTEKALKGDEPVQAHETAKVQNMNSPQTRQAENEDRYAENSFVVIGEKNYEDSDDNDLDTSSEEPSGNGPSAESTEATQKAVDLNKTFMNTIQGLFVH